MASLAHRYTATDDELSQGGLAPSKAESKAWPLLPALHAFFQALSATHPSVLANTVAWLVLDDCSADGGGAHGGHEARSGSLRISPRTTRCVRFIAALLSPSTIEMVVQSVRLNLEGDDAMHLMHAAPSADIVRQWLGVAGGGAQE